MGTKPIHDLAYLTYLADDARAAIQCFFDAYPEQRVNAYLNVALERLLTFEENTLDIVPRTHRQEH